MHSRVAVCLPWHSLQVFVSFLQCNVYASKVETILVLAGKELIYNEVFRCMLCMQWNFRGKQQQPPPVIGFENSVCNLEAMLVKKIHMIYVNLSNKCKNIIKDITSLDALEGHHSGWKCSLPSFNRPNALWLRSCWYQYNRIQPPDNFFFRWCLLRFLE